MTDEVAKIMTEWSFSVNSTIEDNSSYSNITSTEWSISVNATAEDNSTCIILPTTESYVTNDGMSSPVITGIVVGSVLGPAFIFITAGLLIWFMARRRNNPSNSTRLQSDKTASSTVVSTPVIIVTADQSTDYTDGHSHQVLPSLLCANDCLSSCSNNGKNDSYSDSTILVPPASRKQNMSNNVDKSSLEPCHLQSPGIKMDPVPTSAGIDNPSFRVDDELPSTSSAVCLASNMQPNASGLSLELQQAGVRRSYRLDNNTALAIAAQLTRESGPMWLDACCDDTDTDIVIVYKERTAL